MQPKHLFLVIFIMICFGSVYPLGKLGTNNIPPILFSSLSTKVILSSLVSLLVKKGIVIFQNFLSSKTSFMRRFE